MILIDAWPEIEHKFEIRRKCLVIETWQVRNDLRLSTDFDKFVVIVDLVHPDGFLVSM